MVNDQNTIQVLAAGTHIIEKEVDKKYISFIPVNDGVILTLEGFRYDVERFEVNLGKRELFRMNFNQRELK